ncbi:MAG: 50S ribosomal protein L25/general stress protein Ctc [Pseudomonadota bacterium]
MVETTRIAAKPRERAGKGAARAVRRQGRVPGVIYGGSTAPKLIDLDPKELLGELGKPGFFTRVFEVALADRSERVLARDLQTHPVSDRPQHIDFMRVSEGTRIRVAVPVKFVGHEASPGLKRGGVLNVVTHTIDVYCMLSNIPPSIGVNLEGLDIGDSVHIRSVKLPEGVKPAIVGRDFTIAAVAAPSVFKTAEEEAAEAAAKATAAAAIEGVLPVEGAPPGAPGAPPGAPGAPPGAPGAPPGAAGAAPAAGVPAAAAAEKKPARTGKKGGKKDKRERRDRR